MLRGLVDNSSIGSLMLCRGQAPNLGWHHSHPFYGLLSLKRAALLCLTSFTHESGPHLIQTDLPWRRIRLELVRSFLDIDSHRWGHCLHAPHSLDRSSARLVDIGNALLNYRLSIQQTVPTRMKVLYSWNLDNWHAPKQPKRDVRMRKCKRLLAKGPICLQETKWSASEKEVLLQHIPG